MTAFHVRRSVRLASLSAGIMLASLHPSVAEAEGFIIPGETIGLFTGLAVTTLTLNSLSIVAQAQPRDEYGRIPGGWLGVQYATAGLHLTAGFIGLGLTVEGGSDPDAVIAATVPPLVVGSLWTVLAIANTVRKTPVSAARVHPVVFAATQGLDERVRHRVAGTAGWGVGLAGRF